MNEDAISDETTILKFRRFLEKHELAPKLRAAVNAYLGDHGLLLRQGTIMQASSSKMP